MKQLDITCDLNSMQYAAPYHGVWLLFTPLIARWWVRPRGYKTY